MQRKERAMREIVEISIDDVKPDRDEVLRMQGISPGTPPSRGVEKLLREALESFAESSNPIAIISEISIPEFEVVYRGEGLNEESTPLEAIFRKADVLALFALTVGSDVSRRIDELFKSNEFASGSMLDSVASDGTERAADLLQRHFFNVLVTRGETDSSTAIMRYSPGYCGWHMSGQKRLFESLRPEEIGIELLDSFLMKPLKSISGVMVAGEKRIHDFRDSYPFCAQCRTHSCRDRIRRLYQAEDALI